MIFSNNQSTTVSISSIYGSSSPILIFAFIEDVVQKFMNEINKPSLYGAPFGHGEEQMVLPLNAKIRIGDEEPYMELMETVVD